MKVDSVEECQKKDLLPFQLEVDSKRKFYQIFRMALKLLKEHGKVVFLGEASEVQRCISLAEKVKSMQRDISEEINISHVPYKDLWIPKSSDLGLENLEVTRHVPNISISLSKAKRQHCTQPMKHEDEENEQSSQSPSTTSSRNSSRQNVTRRKTNYNQKYRKSVPQSLSNQNSLGDSIFHSNGSKEKNFNGNSKHKMSESTPSNKQNELKTTDENNIRKQDLAQPLRNTDRNFQRSRRRYTGDAREREKTSSQVSQHKISVDGTTKLDVT